MSRLPCAALLVACLVMPFASGCGDDEPMPPSSPDAGSMPDAGPTDTTPPTVTATTPADNAQGVPSASTLVIEFSEPMKVGQGTVRLTPGEVQLRASAPLWDAARRELTLTPAEPLPVSTEVTATVGTDFVDAAGNALAAPVSFRFTVRDDQPPRVLAAAPAEGASQVPLTTSEFSLTFSEPMDTSAGSLIPSGGVTLGAATWEGNTLTAPLSGLEYDSSYSIQLQGFRDVAGNALDTTALLGDGALDFTTGEDTVKPHVVSTTPAEGATGVYPVEVYYRTTGQAGLSERKVLTVQFNEPMDSTLTQAMLHDLTDTGVPARTVEGVWSSDARTLTLTVLQPEEGGPALNGENAYAVDLTGFKDLAGNTLDAAHAGLGGDGRLDFQTGPTDALLNHACGHTLVDALVSVTAAAAPTGTLPRTDQTHKHYELTLPAAGGSYSGYTRMLLAPETPYVLFLHEEASVALRKSADGSDVEASLEPAPPACPGITHQLLFTSPDTPEVRANFTFPNEKLRFILEESL